MSRSPNASRATAVAVLLLACSCSSLTSDPPPQLGSAATSAQIQAARDAADGTGLSLPIQGAYVTYVRPQIGVDVAGFFVQSQATGPALFVAVDPSTLAPVPAAGDQVDLTVTAMATVGSRREATAITGWTRLATGVAIAALRQELSSATDLVSALGAYESELARVEGDLRTDFSGSGSGFVEAGLNTLALTNEPLLAFRLPITLRDSLDLGLGCRVAVTAAPLWRTDTVAQVTAWSAPDLSVVSCPAPRVLSAAALSSTSVLVTFDRMLDAASVLANGSQFAFDGGLVASAASASGTQVTVTTSAQAGTTSYTVTVASTVKGLYGAGVDPAFDHASFQGWVVPAVLRIDEVNANVSLSADLVELRATAAGSLRGIVVQLGVATPTTLASLPDLAVAEGDLVVVHLAPGAGIVTEASAKDECTDAACYDGAWDVAGSASGIPATTRILAIRSALGDLTDAVPFTDGTGTGVNAFLSDLATLQAAGLWLPADCGGSACSLASTPTALAISVDWSGTGTTPTGDSVRRTSTTDTNQASDWAVGASSFGAAN